MTTRRRLLVFGLLAGLLALGVGGWLVWSRTAITRENAAKITEGMTLAEVEAILGGPERDESTRPTALDADPRLAGPGGNKTVGFAWDFGPAFTDGRPMDARKMWATDYLMLVVDFDAGGKVTGKRDAATHPVQESMLDKLRRWLHL
jgi:hypothetical protein